MGKSKEESWKMRNKEGEQRQSSTKEAGTKPKLDPRFSFEKFRGKAKIDSRGRPIHKDTATKLRALYANDFDVGDEDEKRPSWIKEESEEEEEEREVEESEEDDEEEEDEDDEEEEDDEEGADAEEEEDAEEGDDEDSSVADTSEEEEGNVDAILNKEEDIWQGGEIPLREEATCRLSVVNCDWDHMSAEDIFHHMKDFLPPTGELRKVAVYPSEFGKKAMEEERTKGPSIWKEEGEEESEEDDESEGSLDETQKFTDAEMALDFEPEEYVPDEHSEDEPAGDAADEELGSKPKKGKEGTVVSHSKFRVYEMQRLKYYFAIVTFDSPATASHIYDALDGCEILHSSTFFDLRFVPDSMEFDDSEARDICTKLSSNYVPLKPFVANALQNAYFTVSWDQDAPIRKQTVARCFDEDVIRGKKEIDLSNILASSESDTDGEEEAREEKIKKTRERYEKLLEDIRQELPEGLEMDDDDEDADEEKGSEGVDSEEDSSSEAEDEDEEDDDNEGDEGSEAEITIEEANQDEAENEDTLGETQKSNPLIPEDGGEMVVEFHGAEDAKIIREKLLKAKETKGMTLFEKRQAKYKTERKLRKKEKRQFFQEETARIDAEREARREEEAAMLKKIMEPSGMQVLDGEEKPAKKKLNRRENRKQHANKKKMEAAAQREVKKQKRVAMFEAMQRGEDAQTFQARMTQEKMAAQAKAVSSKLDNRFSRLLSDADYAIESSHPKYKRTEDMKAIQQLQHVGQQKRVLSQLTMDSGEKESVAAAEPPPKKVALADYVAKFNAIASSKLQKKQLKSQHG